MAKGQSGTNPALENAPLDISAALNEIVRDEIAAINTRRPGDRQLRKPDGEGILEAAGLALSGGGIRSAATCLGAIQALANHGLLQRIDYLSTVSGGGYIGTSMSAAMATTGQFPFAAEPRDAVDPDDRPAPPAAEIKDTPAVGHIRNYSNYLMPNGLRDLVTAVAIVTRGLIANVGLVLPVVLLLAVLTVYSNPTRESLQVSDLLGIKIAGKEGLFFTLRCAVAGVLTGLAILGLGFVLFQKSKHVLAVYAALSIVSVGLVCDLAAKLEIQPFAISITALLIGGPLFFVWALLRSIPSLLPSEFAGHLPTTFATYLVVTAAIAFFEAQPLMLDAMFDAMDAGATGLVSDTVQRALKWLAMLTSPVAGVVLLLRQQITDLLKKGASQTRAGKVQAWLAKLAIWAASLALPLLIWIAYLHLSLWAVQNNKANQPPPCPPTIAAPACSANLSGTLTFDSGAKTLNAQIKSAQQAATKSDDRLQQGDRSFAHQPEWLRSVATGLFAWLPVGLKETLRSFFDWTVLSPVLRLYIFVAIVLLIVGWLLSPNANSLHRLYRDRLSKAFLFDPTPSVATARPLNEPSLHQGRDFRDLDRMKLSALVHRGQPSDAPALRGPFQLINAALNIQGSDFANRRGRNADFFLISALHVGSEATGYCETGKFENFAKGFDLATAMAVSGAAASSNMGARSIRPLTPTLALLNVRLGYWLINPMYVNALLKARKTDASNHDLLTATQLYLWSELTGRLYENSEDIYLTDGGHIENLGIFELLRRRCRLIIAVDAEADPAVNLPSFVALQRYARIDLGIRIDLPWADIQKTTRAWMAADESGRQLPAGGPHVAIGTIDYGSGDTGYLVYVKSSLTGDENDGIRDYARRYPDFPHETTGDQFFSEEQFEVYRALGFHMTHRWLSGDDGVMVKHADQKQLLHFDQVDVKTFDIVREMLGMEKGLRPAPPPEQDKPDTSASDFIERLITFGRTTASGPTSGSTASPTGEASQS